MKKSEISKIRKFVEGQDLQKVFTEFNMIVRENFQANLNQPCKGSDVHELMMNWKECIQDKCEFMVSSNSLTKFTEVVNDDTREIITYQNAEFQVVIDNSELAIPTINVLETSIVETYGGETFVDVKPSITDEAMDWCEKTMRENPNLQLSVIDDQINPETIRIEIEARSSDTDGRFMPFGNYIFDTPDCYATAKGQEFNLQLAASELSADLCRSDKTPFSMRAYVDHDRFTNFMAGIGFTYDSERHLPETEYRSIGYYPSFVVTTIARGMKKDYGITVR